MPNQNDSDEETEKYYTGGEKSGMMVQGAKPERDEKAKALVEDILKIASQQGQAAPAVHASSSSAPTFSGRGYTLGAENSAASSSTPAPTEPEPLPLVERRLTFWRNGFVIDNQPGVLHSYSDPNNQKFLEQLKGGMANLSFLGLKVWTFVIRSMAKKLN